MKVHELLGQIRTTLQDEDKIRWSDTELLGYYNDCKYLLASERLEDKTYGTITLDPSKSDYSTTGVLRYISAVDDDGKNRPLYPDDGSGEDDKFGIIIRNYNWIVVNNPTVGTEIRLHIVSLPDKHSLDSVVRVGDEQAYKFFILSRAYEKEADTESVQRTAIFEGRFYEAKKMLIDVASANYSASTIRTTKAYWL